MLTETEKRKLSCLQESLLIHQSIAFLIPIHANMKAIIFQDPALWEKYEHYFLWLDAIQSESQVVLKHELRAWRCLRILTKFSRKNHHRTMCRNIIEHLHLELNQIPTKRGRPPQRPLIQIAFIEMCYVVKRHSGETASNACKHTASEAGLEYEKIAKILHSKAVKKRCPYSLPPMEYTPPQGQG